MQNPFVVILGAGSPFAGQEPSALTQTSGDKRVLDWLLEAFTQALENPEFHFVGGYRMDDIVEQYPTIHFSKNEDWDTTGTVASLFTTPLPTDRPVYVCYADTIFEHTAVDALNEATAIAVDRNWEQRYVARSGESLARAEKVRIEDGYVVDADTDLAIEDTDAEFTGLLRLSPDALQRAHALWDARTVTEHAQLPDLLRALSAAGIDIKAQHIDGNWAELETADDLSRFVLDTKANTLRRLASMVTESTILDQYSFSVDQWRTDSESVCTDIQETFEEQRVIVRSSALEEDSWDESNAGRFESVLDVPLNDQQKLTDAIEHVIASYQGTDVAGHQVLVQPMIDDVAQSGVVMTRTLDLGSPYYVINYDARTASTESVTDGTGQHLQTTIVKKDIVTSNLDETLANKLNSRADRPQAPSNISLQPLLAAVRELEQLIGHDSLDVEFAINSNDEVYILQARPITLDPAETSIDDDAVFEALDNAQAKFTEANSPTPFLFGDHTYYGVMPDWNPAEIIGRQPRRLAASLYRYLIMNETWAKQRAEYGYRDVRPHPLMKSFAGQPYVDVRADFNSFIPASVPDDLAERLVEYYLDRLEANPQLHDKVEFEILLTCLPFDYEHRIEPLLAADFTNEELEPLRSGLQEITKNAVTRIDNDLEAVNHLETRYSQITQRDLPPLDTAYYLLEDCRRLGTLPFAHLARTAFVATTLLRSLERIGVLTNNERRAFQNALNTVARQFEHDAYRTRSGDLSWEQFVDQYGHLRPGTYEITSPSYHQRPEKYLQPIVQEATKPVDHPTPLEIWDHDTKHEIETELERIGLDITADHFIQFLVDAIEGREHAKFVFSRNLSEALEQIATFGDQYGFTRDELSHVSIESFFELVMDPPAGNIERWLRNRIRGGREQYALTRSVELPPLLFHEDDFVLFERPHREPNFVTNSTVRAPIVHLAGHNIDATEVDDKIVLIPQADPGYDWLFGHDIAGLVTKYGGVNSHMAVRAAEFSLPAAIGVGETRYDQLRQAEILELDCEARTIRVIQ